ncbi:MarR family winged helix-turn-helix transcriptional regulator [Demequina rhizosphaerae]|uniref:MarR family winged helix-turn-helix transcriptional regulator n=1 Tax=Demequina rhizosphaerae TaxID=1638985 RepID=UPI000782D4CF|nr:MarR family winged helix-turn-helix transcriptional regulator [Demequina rhizosphaerae]
MTTPALEPRDWALWRALALMGRRLVAGLEQRLQAAVGISVPDLDILMALDAAPEGRLRAGSLGEMLGWEKSRISHHVSRMEARGLVARVTCVEDHRGTWVEMDDAGREALAAALPVFAAHLRNGLVDVVPEDEAEVVGRVALRVLDASPATSCQAEIDRLGVELGLRAADVAGTAS